MEEIIKSLRTLPSGYGHRKISIEHNGETLSCITSNMMATDAAFDEYYDDEDNSERYYETRLEAQETLIYEILKKNDVEF